MSSQSRRRNRGLTDEARAERQAGIDAYWRDDANVTRGPVYKRLVDDFGMDPEDAAFLTVAGQYVPVWGTGADLQDAWLYAKQDQGTSAMLSLLAAGAGMAPLIGAGPKAGLKAAAKKLAKPSPTASGLSSASWVPYHGSEEDAAFMEALMTAP
jgi:hypothetical protein